MAPKETRKRGVILPKENAEEVAVVQAIEVLGVEGLVWKNWTNQK